MQFNVDALMKNEQREVDLMRASLWIDVNPPMSTKKTGSGVSHGLPDPSCPSWLSAGISLSLCCGDLGKPDLANVRAIVVP